MPIFRLFIYILAIPAVFYLSACATPAPKTVLQPVTVAKSSNALRVVSFSSLPGWETDNLREAWPAFLASCRALTTKSDWKAPCAAARRINAGDVKAIRAFFERHFVPHQQVSSDGDVSGQMTGYYEPLLRGARKRGGPYQTPLYRKPDDLLTIDLSNAYPELKGMRLRGRLLGNQIIPYPSRAEITRSNQMSGKELLWVDNPVDAFFLQVQGSGQVYLTDSHETVRVAYADQNGHPYKSIGRYLVDQGEMTLEQASAQSIKAWFAANPARQQELLNANPSYVFFKEEKNVHPTTGPKGALGVPLTALRSIAVDPSFVPLGTPVFVAATQPTSGKPLQRLTMAQDTGSAIKGVNRLDYFWGFGQEAGEIAGRTNQRATIWLLLPKHAS